MPDIGSIANAGLELRLRRKIAAAMEEGDFARELEARRLLEQLQAVPNAAQRQAEGTGSLEAMLVAAGGRAAQLGSGVSRLWSKLLGDDEAVAATRAADQERQRMLGPLEEAHPIATTAGTMLPDMAVPGGAAGGLLRRAATAALSGLGTEFAAAGGDMGLGDAAAIAGLSAAGSLAGSGLSRIGTGRADIRAGAGPVPPEHVGMVQRADALGYRTTPGEREMNRTLQKLEAGWERNPYMGRAFDALREGNQDLANGIARRAIGIQTPGMITDEVLEASHKRIGTALRDAAGTAPVALGDDFVDALADIELRHAKVFADTDGERIRTMVNKALDRAASGKPLDVDEYLLQTSELARLQRSSREHPDVARAASELRDALDQAFDASAPGQLPAVREAKAQWRALKELEAPGVLKGGNLSAATLHNKLERLQGGRVRGERPLDEVARLGHHFASTVPNSGTPTGLAMQNFLQAGPLGKAQMLLGEGLGKLYLSPLGRGLVQSPGLFGYPVPGLGWKLPGGALDAAGLLMQRGGREYGSEEATQPSPWGLPLF
ncbi:MAG: hypothetical protein MUE59_06135 [Thiobacillaceae bacterium]|jgi:hypothetical protein|nr:hypothetical protein [Thiobacillaceae bacterium]